MNLSSSMYISYLTEDQLSTTCMGRGSVVTHIIPHRFSLNQVFFSGVYQLYTNKHLNSTQEISYTAKSFVQLKDTPLIISISKLISLNPTQNLNILQNNIENDKLKSNNWKSVTISWISGIWTHNIRFVHEEVRRKDRERNGV